MKRANIYTLVKLKKEPLVKQARERESGGKLKKSSNIDCRKKKNGADADWDTKATTETDRRLPDSEPDKQTGGVEPRRSSATPRASTLREERRLSSTL